MKVGGRKVDLITVRIRDANNIPEYATVLEPTFLVRTEDKEKVAEEISRKIIEIIDEEFGYEDGESEEDRRAIRKFLVDVLEEPPEEPEKWTILLPSEIAYVGIDLYALTGVIE